VKQLTTVELGVSTIDDCVRMVTAFNDFDDLKATQETYAPKFYSRATTTAEAIAQRRVVSAFNAWAERIGREARAFVFNPKGSAC
jgi:predicted GNAT superfamily acetyltransferase